MRTLKKTLALVLVVALVLSISVIGANAFTDTKGNKYEDAINVIAGLGVIDGYADGTYKPADTLTREQAAKVICYITLGPTNAAKLSSASTQIFDDVKTDRWSAGYIEYLYNLKVVSGVDAKNFDPTGKLSTAAFEKMLLVALGYKSDVEGFDGDSWALNVATTAITAGIDDADITLSASTECTRAEAAQLAYLALQGMTVTYTGGSTMTVNGITITTGATKNVSAISGFTKYFKAETKTGILTDSKTLGADFTVVGAMNFNYSADASLLGHNVTVYYKAATSQPTAGYTTYAIVDNTSTVALTASMTAAQTKAAFTAVGVSQNYTGLTTYLNGGTTTASTINYAAANSKTCTVLVYNGAMIGVVLPDSYVISQVAAYKAPTATTTGSVTITGYSAVTLQKIGSTTANTITLYDGIAVGDYVTYTVTGTNVPVVAKTNTVIGALSSFDGTNMVIGGTTYTASSMVDNISLTDVSAATVGATSLCFVLDKAGKVAGYDSNYTAPASSSTYYGVVLAVGHVNASAATLTTAATSSVDKIKFVDATGAVQTLGTKYDGLAYAASTATATLTTGLAEGDLFAYTLNASGAINTVAEAAAADTLLSGSTVSKGTALALGSKYATAATVFFFYQDATHYKVYTGYANLPASTTLSADGHYISNAAVVVPVSAAAVATAATYALVVDDTVTAAYNATAGATLYTVKAVDMKGAALTLTWTSAPTVANGIYEYATTSGVVTTWTKCGNVATATTAVGDNFIVTGTNTVSYFSSSTAIYNVTYDATNGTTAVTAATSVPVNTTSATTYVYYMAGTGTAASPLTALFFYVG